jgi:4'-phosphopantetheinyl transferase
MNSSPAAPPIPWLATSLADHPWLPLGMPKPGLLAPIEAERLAQLVVLKRRQDWLLGRWTAKQLLQRHLHITTGQVITLDRLVILAAADGAPDPFLAHTGDSLVPLPLSLSISHSHGHGLAALLPQPVTGQGAGAPVGGRRPVLGCDLELIEPRELNFVHDFFTPGELAAIQALPPGPDRDTLITVIWSAKEAALKALREGLRLDTRQIDCTIEWPAGAMPGAGRPGHFTVTLSETVAKRFPGAWTGRWWIAGQQAVALAVLGQYL